MRFQGLNLNLLVALQALLDESSVSVAARKMHLSQSSMSGNLARLREHFGDPILDLSGRQMVRTPFGESLMEPLQEAMELIERLAAATASYEPATSTRRFSVVTSDYMIQLLLPHAMPMIATMAPRVSVDFELPSGRPGLMLNKSNIDVLITPAGYTGKPFVSEPFCEEDFVIVGWGGNPAMRKPINLAKLQSMRHVSVQFPISTDLSIDGHSPSFAQVALRNAGCNFEVAVAVPTFATAFAGVIGTNLVTVTHRRLANVLANPAFHVVRELPIKVEPLRESLVYHPLRSQDAGLIWLKGILRKALRKVDLELPQKLPGDRTIEAIDKA